MRTDWNGRVGVYRNRGEMLLRTRMCNRIWLFFFIIILSPLFWDLFGIQTQWESVFSQWNVVSLSPYIPVTHCFTPSNTSVHSNTLDMLAEILHTPRNDRNNSMHTSLHLPLYDGNMVCAVTQEVWEINQSLLQVCVYEMLVTVMLLNINWLIDYGCC